MGFTHCMHPYDVSRRANQAMIKTVQMEISSSSSTVPTYRSTIFGLERFKVLRSDMDRLNPCMICVGEIFLGEEAITLPCCHVFHKSCIWSQVSPTLFFLSSVFINITKKDTLLKYISRRKH
ncbi:predicted protein [Arabidopsis lyrata subsp. lyrata]|uniref:Predicted protein n=1 Tax=Arabidopsis lyrata subsp. lyrata TaxID=81972 RepID=D7M0W0_ARALL|nr:predicted protein [Arabidopsis lyrata subsp. lyrata]